MGKATIHISGKASRDQAHNWIDRAPLGTEITFKVNTRTAEQNRLLWQRLGEIGEQVVWYGQKLSANDWKDVLTASLRRLRVVPGIDAGTFIPLGMRTSQMTKAELSELLALIEAFGAEQGVKFRDLEHEEAA